ncbi:Penicillin-binding protein activator LpoA [bacterium HR39]|nr:Penicillin-binding protein activator LpoA [bacterium HR39]
MACSARAPAAGRPRLVPLLVLVLLAACAPRPAPRAPEPPPRPVVEREAARPPAPPVLPLLLPLSGRAASLGRDLLDAATLALFDAPESELQLVPLDTGDDPARAREAARQAFGGEGGRVVLGPLFAAATREVAQLARAHDALVLSLSNDSAAAAPPAVHILGFTPEEQVRRIVRHAVAAGYGRIAALVPDDAYGRRALAAFRSTMAGLGRPADLVLTYGDDQTELAGRLRRFTDYDGRRAALERRLAELSARDDPQARAELAGLRTRDTLGPPPFDAVLVADGGERLHAVLALLRFYDAGAGEVRLLGTMRWLEGSRPPAFRPELEGAWLPLPDLDLREAFAGRFSAVYGREPDLLAAFAYDVVREAVDLLRAGRRPEPGALLARGGWNGVLGPVRLLPDGTAAHALAVYELAPEGPRLVDPAPREPQLAARRPPARPADAEDVREPRVWYEFPLLAARAAEPVRGPRPRGPAGPVPLRRGLVAVSFQ